MNKLGEKQSPTAFLAWLRNEIPIVEYMNFSPIGWDGHKLSMGAELAANVNDKGTGFGGSLASVSTLCGWSIITLFLREQGRDDDVVIRDSHIEYFLPVTSDFMAETQLPSDDELNLFLNKLHTKGRAGLNLVIEIFQDKNLAMRLSGAYVAIEKPKPGAKN